MMTCTRRLKVVLGDLGLARSLEGLEARHRVKAAQKVPTALTADTRTHQYTSQIASCKLPLQSLQFVASRHQSLKYLRRIILPRNSAHELHILPPVRTDDILRWVRVVHVAKRLELPDRLGVLVDAVDEFLGCAFDYRFICIVPILRVEVVP